MRLTSLYARLLGVYLVLILLWFLSWLTLGDAPWVLALINRGAVPFLFLPVPVFWLLGIFLKRYRSLPFLLAPSLIFAGLYFPYFVPHLAPAAPTPAFSVLTYNVLFSNKHPDAVANVIVTYKPDLVALQEVQPAMMAALVERLKTEYPYSFLGTENSFGTPAIFSRTPFTQKTILDLQADRSAVVIQTTIRNQPITFAAAHLLAFNLQYTKPQDIPNYVMQLTFEQNRQARILLETLDASPGTKILGCDCNSYETSSSYHLFNSKLSSASRQVGWQLNGQLLPNTHPDLDLNHIDHIFYTGSVRPLDTFVIQSSGGSDHLPVLARFVTYLSSK